jgi:hypothetical protein
LIALQNGDERELDGLAGLVAIRRPGGAVRQLVEPGVGVGLQPGEVPVA